MRYLVHGIAASRPGNDPYPRSSKFWSSHEVLVTAHALVVPEPAGAGRLRGKGKDQGPPQMPPPEVGVLTAQPQKLAADP